MNGHGFQMQGFRLFAFDPAIAAWADHAANVSRRIVADPANDRWYRHGRTWFAGVNILPNDARGTVDGGPPLSGAVLDHVATGLGLAGIALDRAQVSVCHPGYPQPSAEESEAAFRYRRDRCAAHVDGILKGADGRRRPGEPHGFVLGVPLTVSAREASPLVVWEGSHEIVRRHFEDALRGLPEALWPETDITEAYHAARREAFTTCRAIKIHALPGECYLVHRLALHGIAPWADGTPGGPDGRMVAYFRPPIPRWRDWLDRE